VSLRLSNDLTELARVVEAVDRFIASHGLPSTLAYAVNLALEEVLTNIITHGYDDDEPHAIDIRLSSDPEWITVSVEDDAGSFDPLGTTHAEPDVTASIDDRPIGGLGIFLVKKVMDHLEYRRHDGRNRLVLKKRLPESTGGPRPLDGQAGQSSADATAGDGK
jgi:anti-sigma regulatory factor (Ser/Thr protein kinase)